MTDRNEKTEKDQSINDLSGFEEGRASTTASSIPIEKSDFNDIKIIEIRYSSLNNYNEDNIRSFKQFKDKKDIIDYYNAFSDFTLWDSFDKERYLIILTLSGGLFIFSERTQKQVTIIFVNIINQVNRSYCINSILDYNKLKWSICQQNHL